MPEPLFYEDWEIGRRYETAAREVTRRDFELFAEVEGHKAALHLDDEYAMNNSVFGKLTAHGILTLAMSAGLMGDMGLFDGTALAFLSMTWEFHSPVCIGDAIRVVWWVSSKRPTSKRERGIVIRDMEVVNQDDMKVCSGSMTGLWKMRPLQSAEAASALR
jgi:acyl dehydratase